MATIGSKSYREYKPQSQYAPIDYRTLVESAEYVRDRYDKGRLAQSNMERLFSTIDPGDNISGQGIKNQVVQEYRDEISKIVPEGAFENAEYALTDLAQRFAGDERVQLLMNAQENRKLGEQRAIELGGNVWDRNAYKTFDFGTKGAYNSYVPQVEQILNYSPAKMEMMKGINADTRVTELTEEEKIEWDRFYKHGRIEEITSDKVRALAENLTNEYISGTNEGAQEYARLTTVGIPGVNKGEPMSETDAKKYITQSLYGIGSKQEFKAKAEVYQQGTDDATRAARRAAAKGTEEPPTPSNAHIESMNTLQKGDAEGKPTKVYVSQEQWDASGLGTDDNATMYTGDITDIKDNAQLITELGITKQLETNLDVAGSNTSKRISGGNAWITETESYLANEEAFKGNRQAVNDIMKQIKEGITKGSGISYKRALHNMKKLNEMINDDINLRYGTTEKEREAKALISQIKGIPTGTFKVSGTSDAKNTFTMTDEKGDTHIFVEGTYTVPYEDIKNNAEGDLGDKSAKEIADMVGGTVIAGTADTPEMISIPVNRQADALASTEVLMKIGQADMGGKSVDNARRANEQVATFVRKREYRGFKKKVFNDIDANLSPSEAEQAKKDLEIFYQQAIAEKQLGQAQLGQALQENNEEFVIEYLKLNVHERAKELLRQKYPLLKLDPTLDYKNREDLQNPPLGPYPKEVNAQGTGQAPATEKKVKEELPAAAEDEIVTGKKVTTPTQQTTEEVKQLNVGGRLPVPKQRTVQKEKEVLEVPKEATQINVGGRLAVPALEKKKKPNIEDYTKIARNMRNGVMVNGNEESTVKMRTETDGNGNWFSFPTLFQNDDGTWVDMSAQAEENWEPVYQEAKRRGEVFDFGSDKDAAIRFGEGSWKESSGSTKGMPGSMINSPAGPPAPKAVVKVPGLKIEQAFSDNLPVKDSTGNVMNTEKDFAILHQTGGGTLESLTKGSKIKGDSGDYYTGAHYYIAPDGKIVQAADEGAVVNHAGKSRIGDKGKVNERAIGIEILSDAKKGGNDKEGYYKDLTAPQIKSVAKLLTKWAMEKGLSIDEAYRRIFSHHQITVYNNDWRSKDKDDLDRYLGAKDGRSHLEHNHRFSGTARKTDVDNVSYKLIMSAMEEEYERASKV